MQVRTVLLVDDSAGDVRLTREAFAGADASIQLHVVSDGFEAIDYLRREATQARRPDLILLDLNLIRMSGLEVLTLIKQDVDLRAIPTDILTTSVAPADIARSYELGANAYITKPQQFEAFVSVVKCCADFWTKVRVPPIRA